MPSFQYRVALADGSIGTGTIDASDQTQAMLSLRQSGARPIELRLAATNNAAVSGRPNAKTRAAVTGLVGELAVLLNAGLPLDRSLSLAIGNVQDQFAAGQFAEMLAEVREGIPLSEAMARRAIFPPAAAAMTEAGEANGQLGLALQRLAKMLEEAEALRRLIGNAMIYPVSLGVIAVGVILLMLLFVIPQFESLFGQQQDRLPAASAFILGASRFVRSWGWWMLAGLALFMVVARQWIAQPVARRAIDRTLLAVPMVGELVRYADIARFARSLGVLVEGQVALPKALALARRTVTNTQIGIAIEAVSDGVRQGGGLAQPLLATGVLPHVAAGFIRTGEETSQLGPMLSKLADVLDRDVKIRLERLIGILTPAITILLGTTVAAIIASIMSAIIGFNELAIST